MLNQIYNWLQSFLSWLVSLVDAALNWILSAIEWVLEWINYSLWLVWDSITDSLGQFFQSFARPSFYSTIESSICDSFSQLSPLVSGINITGPLALLIAAYSLRFVIRRLPLIG